MFLSVGGDPLTMQKENEILKETQTFSTAASLIRGPCLEMDMKMELHHDSFSLNLGKDSTEQ